MTKRLEPTNREKFERRFRKSIENFESIQKATASVNPVTKNNYYRNLPEYFLYLDQDPDTVIAQRTKDIISTNPLDTERYDTKTKAYLRYLEDEKHMAGRGIKGIAGRICGFYSNNSKRLSIDLGRMKISKVRKVQKYSPTNEEIRALYNRADSARDKLIVALMYHNGLVPVDVACLETGDLPAETWSYYEKSRSKTGEIFRAVVTPDISMNLKQYLVIRGERPTKQLFYGREGTLDAGGITQIISILIDKANLGDKTGFKPTSLRDAFEDAMVDANINHKIKESLMGHTSEIESEYGGANKLRTVCVEAIKKIYPLITLNGLSMIEETKDAKVTELLNEIKTLKVTVDKMKTDNFVMTETYRELLTELQNHGFKFNLEKALIGNIEDQKEET